MGTWLGGCGNTASQLPAEAHDTNADLQGRLHRQRDTFYDEGLRDVCCGSKDLRDAMALDSRNGNDISDARADTTAMDIGSETEPAPPLVPFVDEAPDTAGKVALINLLKERY